MASKIIKLRNIKRALTVTPNPDLNYILSGRVSNFRPYKSFNFLDLIDGSTKNHLQVIVNKSLLKKPELGSYLTCQGSLVESRGAGQAIEFKVNKISYLGKCDPLEYPLAITSTNPSYNWYRSLPHLRPRAAHFASLLRVKSEMEFSLHLIMKQMDFFRVHTPSLSSNDSEASSDLFIVKRTKLDKSSAETMNQTIDSDDDDKSSDRGYHSDYSSDNSTSSDSYDNLDNPVNRLIRDDYFKKDVYLVTSAQLHLENLAASLSRVYTLSTAFRAENSKSTTHLSEFSMFEAEEANVDSTKSLMDRVESIIKFVGQFLSEVSEHNQDFHSLMEANENQDNFKKLAYAQFIRMEYAEALDILKKKNFFGPTDYGSDLGRLHERELLNHCDNIPIFITNYPKKLKPFYMKCREFEIGGNNRHEALCFDLIAPHGGEVCGGSLREDDLEKMVSNLENIEQQSTSASASLEKEQQQQQHKFNWYLDSRRFGSFPHGGFGIGIERLLQTLLGLKNIKDTTAFPRWVGHCPM